MPATVRDLALLELQALVRGSDDCLPLAGPLEGFHKVYVDPEVRYRLVIQFRDGPPAAAHRREIYLVAAGPRRGYAVYRAAQHRMGRHNPADQPSPAQVAAARARSPLAVRTATALGPAPGSAPTTAHAHAHAPIKKVHR
ncbi:hypothetical protein ABT009_33760 [Streptomyces sp. NPDC002896]|uniref:hypothetical protein n=1 Tax=Streptomyces sp. NPDC002896 TaxID=3154438 RepID=UPI003332F44B